MKPSSGGFCVFKTKSELGNLRIIARFKILYRLLQSPNFENEFEKTDVDNKLEWLFLAESCLGVGLYSPTILHSKDEVQLLDHSNTVVDWTV